MKKLLYVLLVLILIFFVLSKILKKDSGVENEVFFSNASPLEIINYEFEPAQNKTIGGVDYLVARGKVGKFGGQFIASSLGDGPKTFNPYNSNDNASSELTDFMYSGLVSTDPHTGDVVVNLAKSFYLKEDKMTYVFELRKGLKWSDNKPITVEDVLFTYNTIIFGGFGNTAIRDSLYVDGKLPTIKKINDYTVEFKTPVPFAPFLRMLSVPIAPKHVFKQATDKGKDYFRTFFSSSADPKDFVVSGPFILNEYIPAQRVVYKRNPNYFVIDKEDRKLPYLDKIVCLIVGDLNNQTIKFEAGEIDTLGLQGSSVSRFMELQKHSDYNLYNTGPTTSTSFITFNLNNRKNKQGKSYVEPKKQLWFQDKNFREAIDWAIDRENLVLNVLSGVGEPLFTAEGIPSIFLNKEIATGHPQNLEYSKELLKKSGFCLKDGVLYDKLNNQVEFELLTNAGNTQREATGVSIKEDLNALGIKVNFKPIEFNSLVSKLSNSLDWDCVVLGLTANPLEPHSGYNVWSTNGALHLFNQRSDNDLKSSDRIYDFEKELDLIYDKAKLEPEFEKRKELYDRYQEIVQEYNPLIFLYSPVNIVAVRKKFENIYPTELSSSFFSWAIDEIFIK